MYILLFCFWLLLNGRLTAEICLLGLAVTGALAWLEYALFGYRPKQELRAVRKAPLFLAYVFVLVWEIIKANFQVSKYVLFQKYKITPKLVTFRTDLRTDFGRFLLANSITLTPGTITMEVTEQDGQNYFYVHWIDASADGEEGTKAICGTMQKWLRRIWK